MEVKQHSFLHIHSLLPENFRAFAEGLTIMGLTPSEIHDIYNILAGLIHLFEIVFVEGDNSQGVKVADSPHAGFAAKLLGMEESALKTALSKKTVHRPKRHSRDAGETFQTDRTVAQATAAQEALIKMLYKRLFDWIVERIYAKGFSVISRCVGVISA